VLKSSLLRLLHRFPLVTRGLRAISYRARLGRGEPGGEIRYHTIAGDSSHHWSVTLCSTLDPEEIRRWTTAQTLENIEVTDQVSPDRGWFLAPGEDLHSVPPGWLESALLVAFTESIDAMVLAERVSSAPQDLPTSAEDLLDAPWRSLTLFSAQSYRWDPRTDTVRYRRDTPIPRSSARTASVRHHPAHWQILRIVEAPTWAPVLCLAC